MGCDHKDYSGSLGSHCLRCGEYKHKEGVYVYKLRFEKFANAMTVILIFSLGALVGMSVMVYQLGGSWHYKFENLQKTVSLLSMPVIVNDYVIDTPKFGKQVSIPDHDHNGMYGRIRHIYRRAK